MKKLKKIITTITVLALITGVSGCASMQRSMKTLSSEFGNGLKREIIVYDAVGNELFKQTGKFDVEYENERILYDDEQGNRHVIYFKDGTVIVNEVE